MTPAISEYEAQRLRNIEANKALLRDLGLDKPFFPPKQKAAKAKATPARKRKSIAEDSEEPRQNRRKSARLDPDYDPAGTRRSQRNAGKMVDYKSEQDRSARTMSASMSSKRTMGSNPRTINRRIHDPKQFGSIPGVPVGSWWESRELCSLDAIHAPWVAGISGSPDGAFSVALSGGYDDDVDLGYAFTYTGSGGRDLKGTKDKPKNLRTAPQSSDQTFENHYNKALKRSAESKKPIRVIRGFKLQSSFAPSEGYRYDGLYTVEKAWQEKGLNPKGFLVCKFAFKRVEGQPPIPEKDIEVDSQAMDEPETEDEANEENAEDVQDNKDSNAGKVTETTKQEVKHGLSYQENGLDAHDVVRPTSLAEHADIDMGETLTTEKSHSAEKSVDIAQAQVFADMDAKMDADVDVDADAEGEVVAEGEPA